MNSDESRSARAPNLSLRAAILSIVAGEIPLSEVAMMEPFESESETTIPPSSMILRAAY